MKLHVMCIGPARFTAAFCFTMLIIGNVYADPRYISPTNTTSALDLAIVNVWREPSGPIMGTTGASPPVYFFVEIWNNSLAAYDRAIAVRGQGNATEAVIGLGAGETKVLRLPLLFTSSAVSGTVSNIFFELDPDNIIKEIDETNNVAGPFSLQYYN